MVVVVVMLETLWHASAPLTWPIHLVDPWPILYWAPPVRGRVVDAERGAPLSEVIVVAKWELEALGHPGIVRQEAAIMETVTDNDGGFAFAWYRPRLRWPWEGYLHERSPRMVFFRPHYRFTEEWRPQGWPSPAAWIDPPVFQIRLQPFRGPLEQYAALLFSAEGVDNDETLYSHCSWREYPRMIVALSREAERLRNAGIKPYMLPKTIEERDEPQMAARCGRVLDRVKEYLQ